MPPKAASSLVSNTYARRNALGTSEHVNSLTKTTTSTYSRTQFVTNVQVSKSTNNSYLSNRFEVYMQNIARNFKATTTKNLSPSLFRPHKIALLSLLTSEAKKTPKKNEYEISKQKHDDEEEQEK